MLHVYNTLSRQKEEFKPINENKVGMYVCGITVYDRCHMGHARTYVCFDIIARYLRFLGYDVNYVRNITDIDDKIINRAQKNQESVSCLTSRNITKMHDDFAALGMLPVDQEPRATQYISEMIDMIQTLFDKGIAYLGETGDVYFSVSKFEKYGRLSHQDLDALQIGERVERQQAKTSGLDFVLWKPAKPGEPSWSSPWGDGRPGWHIECSAMSKSCLGSYFDIHGGGSDLTFPHHENEVAQSEAANGSNYVKYWLHTGMVQVNAEKMSKSLGNFFTVADILEKHSAETVRYFLMSSHYRSQLQYTDENLEQADQAIERLYAALRQAASLQGNVLQSFVDDFKAAMDDDFNTPKALAVLFDLAKQINTHREQSADFAQTLKYLGGILGILQQDPEQYFQGQEASNDFDVELIESLIKERGDAKAQKDWSRADAIRAQLDAMGVHVEDCRSGTKWRRKS